MNVNMPKRNPCLTWVEFAIARCFAQLSLRFQAGEKLTIQESECMEACGERVEEYVGAE